VLDALGVWMDIDRILRGLIYDKGNDLNVWLHHSYNIQFVMCNMLVLLRDKGYMELDDDDILDVVVASALHDVGKLAIPVWILNKPGILNEVEKGIVNLHVKFGVDIIDVLFASFDMYNIYRLSKELAEFHHENWDGSGYLRSLRGNMIPLMARICAVADTYVALVENRPYKDPIGHDEAIEIIKSNSGRKFDPDIVDLLVANNECINIEPYIGLSFLEVLMRYIGG
jgi:HD-GYP domain-containing protein (c-di-GMP phosphodiesterase class II)